MTSRYSLLLIMFLGLLPKFSFGQASEADLIKSLETLPESVRDSIYYELFRSELYGDGDLLKANGFALKAYKESKKLNHLKTQAKSARALGMLNGKFTNIDSSEFYFRESVSISRTNGFDDLLVYASNDLGRFYEARDYYDSALKFYQISLQKATALKLSEDMAFALNNIGLTFYYLEDYDEALRHFGESLELKKRYNLGTIGIALKNIAFVYNGQKKYHDALELLNKVESQYKNEFDGYVLADLYDDIAYANYHLGDFSRSIKYYEKSYGLAIQHDNKKAAANALYHFGLLSFRERKYQDCWDNLSASLSLAEQLKSRRLRRDLYLAFHELFIAQGKLEEAVLYQRKYNDIKDSIFNGTVVGNLSKIRLDAQKKDLDSIIQDKESKSTIRFH